MKRLYVFASALVIVVAMVAPALAACPSLPPLTESLGEASVAFVGTVARTSNDGRTATVSVDSIWLGPRLPQTVQVTGVPGAGGDTPSLLTSEDRRFASGRTYLFIPENDRPPFEDNACTATTLYTDEVEALEPEGAIGPESSRSATWIGLLVALAVVGIWQARRARRYASEVKP